MSRVGNVAGNDSKVDDAVTPVGRRPDMTYLLYVLAALYLGLLTSISPCPLATNIAAISYVARKVGNTRMVVHAGLLYTLGRCLLYMALAALLTLTALSIPAVSIFLQKYMLFVHIGDRWKRQIIF